MLNKQIIYLSFSFLFCLQTLSAIDRPSISGGLLDLSNYNFVTDGPVTLKGEWAFYWNRLLAEEFEKYENDRIFLKVPNPWSHYKKSGLPIERTGYGTYRLTILLPPGIDQMGFEINDVLSSSAWYINGNKIGNVGFPAANKYQTVIRVRSPMIKASLSSKEIDLIVQVSNFDYRTGGITGRIVMGLPDQIIDKGVKKSNISFLLIGIFLIIGIYFLIIFLMSFEQYRFYFSILCILMVFRILIVDEIAIFQNLLISGTARFRLEFLSIYLLVPVILLMIHSMFPVEFRKTWLRILALISIVFIFVVIFTPLNIFSYTILFYLLFFLVVVLVLFHVLVEASVRGRTFAPTFTVAIFILVAGLFHDMLNMSNMVETEDLTRYGMLAYLLIYAYIFAAKSVRLISRTESLSAEIQKVNENLEMLIRERTSELEKSSLRLEKQREALEISNNAMSRAILSRNRLFSIIGHDIRGPIGYIRQGLELLNEEKSLNKKDRDEMLKLLSSTAHKTYDLLENLMLWGRTQVGNLEPKPDMIKLQNIIGECLEVMGLGIREKSLNVVIKENLDHEVWIDRDQLLIVVRNLLSNAIKFTPHGGTISIRAIEETENNELILEIKDTGIGIPEKLQAKIFNPGENYSTDGTNHEKGSGLGLKLCQEIIEANKGWIKFTSRSGKGSTFRIGIKTSPAKA
ncbi:MAG: sensor histidine kinase [Bacteroidales bacterium]|nr:sensor histidine kinase [Bacteroidales bacterium]